MQRTLLLLPCVGLLLPMASSGQGTFIYDQQSSDESYIAGGGIGIQAYSPMGQSFTPTNTSVGFIRIWVADNNFGNSLGATVRLNLRSNSVTGPILDSTAPVSMPDSFVGTANFFFSNPVPVVPGATYAFQPEVLSGDTWLTILYNTYNYTGGSAFEFGSPFLVSDLWFREGIFVPEPSSTALFLAAGLLLSRYVGKRLFCNRDVAR